ncbi:hypothetical protein GLW05_20855 [Pontibacillus yanchengensis]|uniref:Major capsid protein n=1 Tax=Pontibacillus yanchengensis TaxID=462910 RepID=A0A6I5A6S2_9BACI|nr:hypothetical protein [Pontibacillus yanchengensis]MYL36024.1 hypothetical protein [Pontibacillus yanchengensis]
MTKRNYDLFEELDNSKKSITTSDLDNGVLTPEKQEEYIRVLHGKSVVLKDTHFIDMGAQQVDIDRTGFGQRVMRGIKADGTSEESKPYFKTNKLIAKPVGFDFALQDHAARRSIEKDNLGETLIAMAGATSAVDLEDLFFNGNTESQDPLLVETDGWFKKATHQETVEVDYETVEDIEKVFEKALEVLPKEYFDNPEEYAFYVPYDVHKAYRDLLKERATQTGDDATTKAKLPDYEGIPVKHVNVLNRPESGDKVLLCNPRNMVHGIFYETTIEDQRNAKKRQTDYVVTAEADCHFENQEAAVTVTITEPSA